MRSDKHFRLRTLGRLSLEIVVGEVVVPADVRPRHLAILAVLALSPRGLRRDALAAMFWGEQEDERARHSLSNALSALRGVLGSSAITARRDEVAVGEDLRLEVDALEFVAACEARDDVRAAALYGGPFLEDVAVPDASGFDAWLDPQRTRFQRLFLSICERYAPALLRARDWTGCAALAERWLHAAPESMVAFSVLLQARSGPGSPAALRIALAECERVRRWLLEEHGIRPDTTVQAQIAELEAQLAAQERTLAAATTAAPAPRLATAAAAAAAKAPQRTASVPPVVVRATDGGRRRARVRQAASGIALAGAIVLAATALFRRGAATPTRVVVAIPGILVRGDSVLQPLEDGLPRLITDDLSAAGMVDAVSPARVRDMIVQLGRTPNQPLTDQDALDVARRVGATWSVTGGVTALRGTYVLDLGVRDVASGDSVQSFTVTAADPAQLGRLAASRLADIASASAGRAVDLPASNSR